MPGTFEEPPLFPQRLARPCPKCGHPEADVLWRDAVWEETGLSCPACGHEWVKG